ncbi:MAG: FAD:protein FMN transferase [Flavobacteriaceae bacterium]|nr:FAD:protein FMN transferase [Flavobacteriaceae bacterium]MDO7616226.1 FAD:protein FMN transferase [Flavobacteriaceae bacterium]MDO7703558.1 FAD:protein FMN transferase [Flavobacteriaceae bacterium]
MKNTLVLMSLFLSIFISSAQKLYSESSILMGSSFEITVVAEDEDFAKESLAIAKKEIIRIEDLISSWDQKSETSRINRNAGIAAVEVSKELFDLIFRAQQISKLSSGAFDLTFAAIDKLWNFDGKESEMPNPDTLKASVFHIGYQLIELDEESLTVFLPKKGMKIGFGAIGKGYAADRAKQLLVERGVLGGIINASGDMNTWGTKPDGSSWTIGIVNPMNNKKVFSWFSLEHNAVVTSGDYEKFTQINGRRYSHIIDPRTGIPSQGIVSCTVFAGKAELADAIATAIFVMGVESGLFLIDQLPNIEAILIDDSGIIHRSKNIEIEEN